MAETALEEVTDLEVHEAHADHRQVDFHVGLPGRIESYDSNKQTCTVTPEIRRHLPDGDGNYVTEDLPTLSNVPVKFQRCKKFTMTFPLEKGDKVLLFFCERNIGNWRALGTTCDPGDVGMHTLDGAVAIPGLFDDASPDKTAAPDRMTIGSATDDKGRIECLAAEIQLGHGASDFVALASLVKARLDLIQKMHDTHTHPVTGSTAAVTTMIIGTIADVASSNAKAL